MSVQTPPRLSIALWLALTVAIVAALPFATVSADDVQEQTPTPTQTPAFPAPELTARTDGDAVHLTWSVVNGAARYQLATWWADDPGWQPVSDAIPETTYTHAGITAGTTYFYSVRALDDNGGPISGWSQNASATVGAASTLPVPQVTAEGVAGAVNLHWGELPGATRYELWTWWGDPPGWQMVSDSIPGPGFTHGGRASGATYYYAVRGLDADGRPVSEWSENTLATVPGATVTPTPPTQTPTLTTTPVPPAQTPTATATLPAGGVLNAVLHESVDVTFEGQNNRITWERDPGELYYNLYFCFYVFKSTDPDHCNYYGFASLFRQRYVLLASELTGTTYLHENAPRPKSGIQGRYQYFVHGCTNTDCPILATAATRPTNKDIDLDSANDFPRGIWSDGATIWVADNSDNKLYAYDLATGGRTEAREFNLANDNSAPSALWSDGATIWVADREDARLYAYSLAGGARVEAKEFNLAGDNNSPGSFGSDGVTVWVADDDDAKVYAYELSTGARLEAKEFSLDANNSTPTGLWSDSTTIWVADFFYERLYAYELTTGDRLEPKEIVLVPENAAPWGSWSDGATVWVADNSDNKLYAYNISASLPAQNTPTPSPTGTSTPTPTAGTPVAPVITATAGADYITLAWETVAGASAYELWTWWNESIGWQQIGGSLAGTSFKHENLTIGTTYYYTARALDANGKILTGWSDYVSAIPGNTLTPTPALTITFTPTATIPAPTPTPTPTSIIPTLTTVATVTATVTPGATIFTATATTTPTASPLIAPTLNAQAGVGEIHLRWESLPSAVRYELWVWWSQETDWQLISDTLTGATYTHSRLTVDVTYYYAIRALDAGGNAGPWSKYVSATVSDATETASPTPTLTALYTSTPAPTLTATPTLTPPPTATATMDPRPALPPPPSALGLDPYYRKYLDAGGIPVVAPADVDGAHLHSAAGIIVAMLANRADLRATMIQNSFRVILYKNDGCRGIFQIPELRTELPPGRCDQDTLGAAAIQWLDNPFTGELLLIVDVYGVAPGSQYCNSVFVHEFAHLVHYAIAIDSAIASGRPMFDSPFDARIESLYNAALATGLYSGAYAATKYSEYWAEAVTFWFLPNHLIGRVRTPATVSTLADYDPRVASLVQEVFGNAALPACEPEYFKVLGTVTTADGQPMAGVYVEATARVLSEGGGLWGQLWKSTLPTESDGAYVIALSKTRLERMQQRVGREAGSGDLDSFFILGVAGGDWDLDLDCVAGYLGDSGQVENISPADAYAFAIPGGDLPGIALNIASDFDWFYRSSCFDAYRQYMIEEPNQHSIIWIK